MMVHVDGRNAVVSPSEDPFGELGLLFFDPAEGSDVRAGRPPAGQDAWLAQPSCEGAAGSTSCTFTGASDRLIIRVDNVIVAAGGEEPPVIEVRFEARR